MRILLAAAALAAAAPTLAQGDPAIAPVQALDAGLLAIMKAHGAGLAGRAATLGPVVDRSFDIPQMTRIAVGPAWNKASPADQTALVAAFRRLTVNGFAKNFDSFSGHSFTVSPQVEARGGDRLVRTTLNDPSGSPVSINYRLREGPGGWRIIDVLYNSSISQLATRRADFASVLAQGGPRALVQHLDALAKAGG